MKEYIILLDYQYFFIIPNKSKVNPIGIEISSFKQSFYILINQIVSKDKLLMAFIEKQLYFYIAMNRQNKSVTIQNFSKDNAAKQPEFECVTALADIFQRQIEEPIVLRESIMKNSEMQRCMLHNIIFSIYCTVCRKILCASCMYTSTLHRKHRVVPIESATDEIREDLRTFQAKIPRILQQLDSVTIINNEFLVKIEKDISPVVSKLQQFYEGLRNFIKQKEKEQLVAIREKRQEIRAEVNAYNKELSRVHQYIEEKCKSYANHNIKLQLLIPARNILQNLLLASQYSKQPHFINQRTKFTIEPQKIKGVLQDISYKINQFIVFPVFPKNQSKTTISTPKSVDNKLKTTFLSPKNIVVEYPNTERRKRVSSSIAGARTYRKT